MKKYRTLAVVILATIVQFCIAQQVNPLITTEWGQEGLYNDLCPSKPALCQSGDKQLFAGCVAIALAQIMKKYNHPATSTGSNSYTDPENLPSVLYTCNIPAATNFASFNTSFNWSVMPSTLVPISSSEAKANVQKLIYLAGIGSNMDYGTNGSGSIIDNAKNALATYFKYDATSMKIVSKSSYTALQWENLLVDELNADKVIYYRGSGPDPTDPKKSVGHAFIIDGYKKVNNAFQFHVNWGWDGYLNGWYAISALNPSPLNFSSDNKAIIGIKPLVILPTNVQASDGNFTDRVRITWNGTSGNYFKIYRNTTNTTTGATAISDWMTNTSSYDDVLPTAGVKFYYFVQAASNASGAYASVLSIGNDGFRQVTPDLRLNSSITPNPNPIKQGQALSVTVDLKNFGTTAFSGDLACSLHNINDPVPLGDIEVKTGVSVAVNGTVRFTFSKSSITANAGSYDLYIKQKPTGKTWSALPANSYINPLRVTVQAQVLPTVPQNVSASDGVYSDKVRVTWTGTSGNYFRVLRNTTNSTTTGVVLSNWQNASMSFDDYSATAGVTYYYFVQAASSSSGTNASNYSTINSGFRLIRPSNDEPCNAITITPSISGSFITGSTINATTTTTPTTATSCATAANDVWYKFVIPSSGSFTIVTKAGSMTNAVIGVYAGNCSTLSGGTSSLCKDNNTNGTKMPVMPLTSTKAGSILYIRVWGYGGTTGTFTIGVLNYYSTTTYNLTENTNDNNLSEIGSEPVDNGLIIDKLLLETKPGAGGLIDQNTGGSDHGFNTFPNPANNILNLEYSAQSNSQADILLLDVTGRVVKQSTQFFSRGKNAMVINVGNVQAGMYVVKLQTLEGIKTQKILIQH